MALLMVDDWLFILHFSEDKTKKNKKSEETCS